jgi:hypothetical protein
MSPRSRRSAVISLSIADDVGRLSMPLSLHGVLVCVSDRPAAASVCSRRRCLLAAAPYLLSLLSRCIAFSVFASALHECVLMLQPRCTVAAAYLRTPRVVVSQGRWGAGRRCGRR